MGAGEWKSLCYSCLQCSDTPVNCNKSAFKLAALILHQYKAALKLLQTISVWKEKEERLPWDWKGEERSGATCKASYDFSETKSILVLALKNNWFFSTIHPVELSNIAKKFLILFWVILILSRQEIFKNPKENTRLLP